MSSSQAFPALCWIYSLMIFLSLLSLLLFPPAHFFPVPLCIPPIDFLLRRALEHCTVARYFLEQVPVEKSHEPCLCKCLHHQSILSASPSLANARILSHIFVSNIRFQTSTDIRRHPKHIIGESKAQDLLGLKSPSIFYLLSITAPNTAESLFASGSCLPARRSALRVGGLAALPFRENRSS